MRKAIFLAIIILVAVGTGFIIFSAQTGNTDNLPVKDLSSTITSARDLTGAWSGTVVFTERVPQCNYQGEMVLNLVQAGKNLNGGYQVTVTSADGTGCVRDGSQFPYLVSGTVSSSNINLLIANADPFKGSFTSDLMTLRQSKCEECGSGPAIVFAGPVQLRREE